MRQSLTPPHTWGRISRGNPLHMTECPSRYRTCLWDTGNRTIQMPATWWGTLHTFQRCFQYRCYRTVLCTLMCLALCRSSLCTLCLPGQSMQLKWSYPSGKHCTGCNCQEMIHCNLNSIFQLGTRSMLLLRGNWAAKHKQQIAMCVVSL